jgi:sodium pump decarboxylase gamma subunit
MVWGGIELTAVGMTTVFAFLGLLVGLMQASAALFEAFGHRFPVPPSTETTSGASGGASRDEEIAIVLAAVEAHRRQRRGA